MALTTFNHHSEGESLRVEINSDRFSTWLEFRTSRMETTFFFEDEEDLRQTLKDLEEAVKEWNASIAEQKLT